MRQLDRSLGLASVVAVSVGAMLGGEIFVLPAVAAGITGPSLWLAFLAAALLVLPAAFSKSELATAIPAAGGSYVYLERGLGPLAGTIGGIGLWLSLTLKSAFALVVLGTYLDLLVTAPARPVAIGLLGVVLVLNLVGVKKLGKVQTVVVGSCLSVLFLLIVVGFWQISHDGSGYSEGVVAETFFGGGLEGFLAAVGLVFISYAGVTKIAAIAEEVQDESKNIPRGMMISLGIMTFVYVAISWVLLHLFTAAELEGDPTPIASLAAKVFGAWGSPLLAVTAVLALIAMANAGLLAASRFPFAMSRDRLLPTALDRVHPRFVTPVTSVLLTGLVMFFVLAFLDVIAIAKVASSLKIAAFAANNLALIVLRESGTHWYRPSFRSPLYPWIQIVGVVTGLVLLVAMGKTALVGVGSALAVGAVAYLGYGRKVARIGVLRQLLHREDILASEPSAGAETRSEDLPGGHTVVTLVGRAESAEALVHLGATLAEEHDLEVLLLQEVSEQGEVFALPEEEADRIASLERRVLGLARERGVPARFDNVVTRDIRRTLFDTARRSESRWVVMPWRNRRGRGFILRNPYEWLMAYLPCNLALFKDAGIRTYRKILVIAEPGPHDALVARTADDLAALFRAKITLARFLPETAREADHAAVQDYHDQLTHLCRHVEGAEILHGSDELTALIKATARFDLMVLGAPPEIPLRSMLFTSREDHITEHAHCAVLRLKTPREETHEAVEALPGGAELEASRVLEPRAVRAGLQVARKESLFAELSAIFAGVAGHDDAAGIERAFWEREKLQNTAVGDGVAMPHATLDGLAETHLGIFTLDPPIPYGSADKGSVDVVLCTVGPPTDRGMHLRMLATLARLILGGSLLPDLRRADDDPAILEAFREAMERVDASREAAS